MKDTNEFKDKLEIERTELFSALGDMGMMNPESKDWEATPVPAGSENDTSDENDNADRFEEYEERSAKVPVLEQRLKDVEVALEKIDAGTYGMCEVCNQPIETERLKANPAARTCMAHMEGK